MQAGFRSITAVALLAFSGFTFAGAPGAFDAIKESDCIDPYNFTGFLVGNSTNTSVSPIWGVPAGQWSMMSMWQGDDFSSNVINYDIGKFTGLHGVPPAGQRGARPRLPPYYYPVEDPDGSPGVQVNCHDAGMLLNTWETPHRPVVGGSYNNLWGYAWANSVNPFRGADGKPTELVVQGEIAVPLFYYVKKQGTGVPVAQIVMFAMLRDITNPSLHAIAVMGTAFDSGWGATMSYDGYLAYDFGNSAIDQARTSYPQWYPGASANGVWFTSQPIGGNYPYMRTRYSTLPSGPVAQRSDLSAPLQFFRYHISPKNLLNVVNGINAHPCSGPPQCPAKGYSTNPDHYVVEYAGVIAETTLGEALYDAAPWSWVPNDGNKDQVVLGTRIHGLSFWRYTPRTDEDTVEAMYQGLLARDPDSGGYSFWLSSAIRPTRCNNPSQLHAQLNSMSSSMVWGGEYVARGTSNQEFVSGLYKSHLRRDADAGGLGYWTSQLNGGLSRETLRQYFVFSQEYVDNTVTPILNESCM